METVLTLARTNETIHAERILVDAGLTIHVMPLPSAIRAGCGVCLRLPQEQLGEAVALLAQAGIPVESLYLRTMVEGRSTYSPYAGDVL